MKLGLVLGIIGAVLLHVGFILFGGLLIPKAKEDHGTLQQVELLSENDVAKKDDEKPNDEPDEIKTEEEAPPDATEIIRNMETPIVNDAPALDTASLSAIEAALNGQSGGGGDFAQTLDFASGGRIGGTGKGGSLDEKLEEAFSMSEIDQHPRPTFQTSPVYPSEMRGKKLEGVVSVIFIVDAAGKVSNPRVEKSNNPAFEKPALEAIKKWKFEPGVKGGQRVACKMRAPIRFPPS